MRAKAIAVNSLLNVIGGPKPGTRWRGHNGIRQETRIVVDRTFGGSVVYRTRHGGRYYEHTVTLAVWLDFKDRFKAKKVKP